MHVTLKMDVIEMPVYSLCNFNLCNVGVPESTCSLLVSGVPRKSQTCKHSVDQ